MEDTIIKEILRLKSEKDVVILAHYYLDVDEETDKLIKIPNVADGETVHSFQSKYGSSLLSDSLEAITTGSAWGSSKPCTA